MLSISLYKIRSLILEFEPKT